MKKYNRGDGFGWTRKHPRTMTQTPMVKADPKYVFSDIWVTIDILRSKIEELENKDKHNNKVIQILNQKIHSLSRRHQRTRDIACACRNIVSPISQEERQSIRNDIKARKNERKTAHKNAEAYKARIENYVALSSDIEPIMTKKVGVL